MKKEIFRTMDKLYHYTSVASALKILDSNKLRFGELKRMNDINEAYRDIFYDDGVNEKSLNKELSRYKQISFTKDTPNCGYAIPAMWGHYAERGNGVCLVFDKAKLLSRLTPRMQAAAVGYEKNHTGNITVDSENITAYFKQHTDEIFFTKTMDWSYEQEFRVLIRTNGKGSIYLPLEDSIVAIIMNYAEDVEPSHSVFDSFNAKLFEKMFPEIQVLEMGEWTETANLRDKNGYKW